MRITAGIDAGCSAVKAAIMRSDDGGVGELLASEIQRIRRRDVGEVVRSTFEAALSAAGMISDQIDYIASTGDGDTVPFRTGHFYSMTTHARGALFLDPEARAVMDIGALHARAIRIDERGKVLGHRMTSQCASGSGQFLENIARYLGVTLEDIGPLSLQAQAPEGVSSICAVLAETDVINMVSRGITTADILKGIHQSIAGRLVKLLRAAGSEGVVLVTGGLSNDTGLLGAMEEDLAQGKGTVRSEPPKPLTVRTHPDAILAGAYGAALLAAKRHAQLEALGRLEALRA